MGPLGEPRTRRTKLPAMSALQRPDVAPVRAQLLDLQDRICAGIEGVDGKAKFCSDELETPGGGVSRPRVLEGGERIEKAAVNFSHTRGKSLPPAATARKPELAGRSYEAVSVSLIVHPRNPYAPTSHANTRCFIAEKEGEDPVWWFGGGFDLTPFYGFDEDCADWHRVARDCVERVLPGSYAPMKSACDEYFFLKHRGEPRGIGGLFYDDFDAGGDFAQAFALHSAVGDGYLQAIVPILERRVDTPFGERERHWQLVRRGRYVEFNLVWDRGTLFGLQSGGRVESILASMPPEVRWRYDHQPEEGSPEHRLLCHYLTPQDWVR